MDEYFAPKMDVHAEPSGNVVSFIPLYNETVNKDFILDKYTEESVKCQIPPKSPPKIPPKT
jgi:hypothetical protein